ncbi:hypothetical protein N0V83_001621 [Neocucurbitaria cava]|uniref:Uncharacterized protein n=1 Tax=Neocucurbitaria cava TaxID=798079 RepID=A0A9W8YIQ5_9PLEO|nr:hypothetical protein N0V83_001621 [Neocucurbitaria cava]
MPFRTLSTSLRARANQTLDRFRMRVQTRFEDERINIKSQYNVVKDTVKDTVLFVIATGLRKVVPSFKRTRFRDPACPLAAVRTLVSTSIRRPANCRQTTSRGVDRGRIDKEKRYPAVSPYYCSYPNVGRYHEPADSDELIEAFKLASEIRAQNEQRERLNRFRIAQQEADRRSAAVEARERAIAEQEAAELCPPPPYSSVERQRFYHERLKATEGTMVPVTGWPSGHSGIDPVMAEHNQRKFVQEFHDQVWACQVEEHRQLAQQEEERQRILGLLEVGRARYMKHVEMLANYGPQLHMGINMMKVTLRHNNMSDLALLTREMITGILEPVHAIFQEMNENIPLEEEGAHILKNKWPIKHIDEVYIFLKNEDSLPPELVYFLQGIEAICKPISNPTPFINPLNPQPYPVEVPPTPAQNITTVPKYDGPNLNLWNGLADALNDVLPQVSNVATAKYTQQQYQQQQYQQQQYQQQYQYQQQQEQQLPTIIISAPTGLPEALNDALPQVSSVAATQDTQKHQQHQQQHLPTIIVSTPSAPSSAPTPDSQEKQNLMQHMQSSLFDLQEDVQKLLEGETLPPTPRNGVRKTLQAFLAIANGKMELLGDDEGRLYKNEVQRVVTRIANLKNKAAKKAPQTKELDTLAYDVLNVWFSDL